MNQCFSQVDNSSESLIFKSFSEALRSFVDEMFCYACILKGLGLIDPFPSNDQSSVAFFQRTVIFGKTAQFSIDKALNQGDKITRDEVFIRRRNSEIGRSQTRHLENKKP